MRIGTALLLAACSLAAASSSVDAVTLQTEEVVGANGRRSLAVKDSFIASGVVCKEKKRIAKEIKQACKPSVGLLRTGASDGEEVETKELTIKEHCFINFKCSSATVASGALDFLIRNQDVRHIEADLVVTSNAPWGLDRLDQADLPLDSRFSSEFDGSGVNIYVVDTGVNSKHVEFSGRVEHGEDFINENPSHEDLNGHGTHCAGSAAGSSYGVATGAKVFGVKVLSGGGSGSTSGVIGGIEWAVSNQDDNFDGESAVISMSLGGGYSESMNDAAVAASDAGMIVVVAAGNDNDDACDYSPAGAGGSGSSGGVITVMASDRNDRRASFSSYGSCTDIIAPGVDILSAWVGSSSAKNTISGTSMATPHVAGVAATLLEKHGKNKAAAQAELFSDAVSGRISDVRSGSKNLLLQVGPYTGPPTNAPVPLPTSPPVPAPGLCVGEFCPTFETSEFGEEFPSGDDQVYGELAVSTEGGGLACKKLKNKKAVKGKILVVQRGTCLFTEKVRNAQRAGAKAVIIVNNDDDAAFPPQWDGDSKLPRILSGMVSRAEGAQLEALEGTMAVFGAPGLPLPPNDGDDGEGGGGGGGGGRRRRRRRRRRRGLVGDADQSLEQLEDIADDDDDVRTISAKPGPFVA